MQYQKSLYAGFWKRFLSHILDQIILSLVYIILFVPFILIIGISAFPFKIFGKMDEFGFTAVVYQEFSDEAAIAAVALFFFIFIASIMTIIIEWLYYALMESSKNQATLGKMIVGIVVTDMHGNRVTFGKATGRFFSKIISGIILYIGYIIAGFTEKKQALHDMIAGCLVVNKTALIIAQQEMNSGTETKENI